MTDISKNQSKMLKGIAIFFMLSLHDYSQGTAPSIA